MKTEWVQSLTANFEAHAQHTGGRGILAGVRHPASARLYQMGDLGSGSPREVDDIKYRMGRDAQSEKDD